MYTIKTVEQFDTCGKNRIVGIPKEFEKSSIVFEGEGNCLYIEENVILKNCTFTFKGENSLVYISESKDPISLSVLIYNDSTVFVGRDISLGGILSMVVSEARNVFIGNDCLISKGCAIRTGDAHRVYDINTGKRLNEGKSVFLGDHIWVGHGCHILKGAKLYSGCVIGLGSIVTGKEYYSNTAYAGNPAKIIAKNIAYDKKGTHGLNSQGKQKISSMSETELSRFIFRKKGSNSLAFEKLDEELSKNKPINERIIFLQEEQLNAEHNRFALDMSN